MKAIAITPGTTDVQLIDLPEPNIAEADEVKLQIINVGICGTDREEVNGGRADAPAGQKQLVIGHEMFGRVVAVGSQVKKVEPGDYAVFSVRRGCGYCFACLMNRSDMCYSGEYSERGIKGANGFQTEYVVDKEQYVVKVPAKIAHLGVLTEPMSVIEKAIDEAVAIQLARLPDMKRAGDVLRNKVALVAGLGPIGLLAAVALRLRGAKVIGLDIIDENSPRAQLLAKLGGVYVDGRKVQTDALDDHLGQIDMILEATGVAALEFNLIDALGINGVYVITGIPGGDRPVDISGAALMRQLVLYNQVLVGSVNASPAHFQMAVDDLKCGYEQWPQVLNELITRKVPYAHFHEALTQHSDSDIKVVIEWSKNGKSNF
ncbi:MAG: glucose 1-dehydrogenase [Caldilineaceae bacterium]